MNEGLEESIPELLTWGADLIVGNCIPRRDKSEAPVIKNNAVPLGRGLDCIEK